MIVWLASYPRSGNSLCRLLIENTIGIDTYSESYEKEMSSVFGEKDSFFTKKVIGSGPQKIRELIKDKKLWLIKTHRIPLDNYPAIYIYRNGLNAVASYKKFKEIDNIERVILGEATEFADWSRHLMAWQPFTRPQTLVIKYEDMLADLDGTAESISKFLDSPVLRKFENPHKQCQKAWPRCFNKTSTKWQDYYDEKSLKLFFGMHGECMEKLGYSI